MLDLNYLKEFFEVKEIQYAGVDGAVVKATLQAKKKGKVKKERLGLEIIIKGKEEETVNEIKRMGYLNERQQPMILREGDQLIVYISKSTA